MKNLKKLSVVLFATLLSFNFTSCIDDGVSDAVDQVYLAQAQFLLAQAALKEAEAQFALARAAHEQAEAALTLAYAEVELAYARETDANTALLMQDLADNVAAAAFLAAQNVMSLAKWQAELDVYLQEQMTLLAEAQSAHEVAMVALGEAVANAKNQILLALYSDYQWTTNQLNQLNSDLLTAEYDLARKELMAVNYSGGMVTYAYFQAQLENDLTVLEGMLAAKEAGLAALMAVTADDASDAQKAIQDLDDQIAVLESEWVDLTVSKEEAENAMLQAQAAWEASTDQYDELIDAQELWEAAVAALKEHTDEMAADTARIAAHQDTIDVHIPAAYAAKADALQAYLDAIADLEAAQDALGTMDDGGAGENDWDDGVDAAGYFFDNFTGPFGDPPHSDGGDFEALSTGTTLYDLWWNAAVAEANAQDALDCAELMMEYDDWWGGAYNIQVLEYIYAARQGVLEEWVPGTPIATLEANLAAALAEEEAAQAAYLADPAGGLHEDAAVVGDNVDDLDQLGLPDDGEDFTYMQVIDWTETFTGSGRYYPSAFAPTKYTSTTVEAFIDDVLDAQGDDVVGLSIPHTDETAGGEWQLNDREDDFRFWHQDRNYYNADGDFIWQSDEGNRALSVVQDAMSLPGESDITRIWFVEVEEDDTYQSNYDRLQAAREAAFLAQEALDAELSDGANLTARRDVALANLTAGYACLGYDIDVDINGTLGQADFNAVADYIAGLEDALEDAEEAADDAEDDVNDAIAAIGDTFAEYDDPAEWVKLGGNAAIDECTFVDDDNPTYFELVECAIIEWNLACIAIENLEDTSWWSGDFDDHEEAIAFYWARIAANAALIPSHEYAIEYLLEKYEALLDEFGFDLDLWDFEGGHGLAMTLDNLPLYAAFLDAQEAYWDVIAEFTRVDDEIWYLENLRGAWEFWQTDGVITNVSEFMGDIAAQISQCETDIAALVEDIENQEVLIAEKMLYRENLEAWLVELQRRIDVINTKIATFESANASLLARINALLAG